MIAEESYEGKKLEIKGNSEVGGNPEYKCQLDAVRKIIASPSSIIGVHEVPDCFYLGCSVCPARMSSGDCLWLSGELVEQCSSYELYNLMQHRGLFADMEEIRPGYAVVYEGNGNEDNIVEEEDELW